MKTTRLAALLATTIAACWGSQVAASNTGTLTVHEWGTFTSFQSEDGNTIAGINVDDEPVPDFVHRLRDRPDAGRSHMDRFTTSVTVSITTARDFGTRVARSPASPGSNRVQG